MEYEQARALLEAPGGMLEVAVEEVQGRPVRVFKQRERSMREKVHNAMLAHGDKEFLVHGDRRFSYREFGELVWGSAHALIEQHRLEKGDRIGILAFNRPEWLIALFGATSAGGVAVGLNGWWHTDEISYGLRDSGCHATNENGMWQSGRCLPRRSFRSGSDGLTAAGDHGHIRLRCHRSCN